MPVTRSQKRARGGSSSGDSDEDQPGKQPRLEKRIPGQPRNQEQGATGRATPQVPNRAPALPPVEDAETDVFSHFTTLGDTPSSTDASSGRLSVQGQAANETQPFIEVHQPSIEASAAQNPTPEGLDDEFLALRQALLNDLNQHGATAGADMNGPAAGRLAEDGAGHQYSLWETYRLGEPHIAVQTTPIEAPGITATGEAPMAEAVMAEAAAATSQNNPPAADNVDDDRVYITGARQAPPVDLTYSPPPSPPLPLSLLGPDRFRYIRPGRPRPRTREPTIYQDHEGADWSFDYAFSDEDDVPKSLLNCHDGQDYYDAIDPDVDHDVEGDVIWDADREWGEVELPEDSRTRDEYALQYKPPVYPLTSAYPTPLRRDHDAAQERRLDKWAKRIHEYRGYGLDQKDPTFLIGVGLRMNRILRIYYNGCLRGAGPLGEELGRPQGAVTDRPFNQPTSLPRLAGSGRFKEPLRHIGLHALYRHRDRLREALDGIPIIFKCRFEPSDVHSQEQLKVQRDLQNRLKETMARCRGETFRSGFELLSPEDLQAVTRIVRFADDRWKTPVKTEIPAEQEAGREGTSEVLEIWVV